MEVCLKTSVHKVIPSQQAVRGCYASGII